MALLPSSIKCTRFTQDKLRTLKCNKISYLLVFLVSPIIYIFTVFWWSCKLHYSILYYPLLCQRVVPPLAMLVKPSSLSWSKSSFSESKFLDIMFSFLSTRSMESIGSSSETFQAWSC